MSRLLGKMAEGNFLPAVAGENISFSDNLERLQFFLAASGTLSEQTFQFRFSMLVRT